MLNRIFALACVLLGVAGASPAEAAPIDFVVRLETPGPSSVYRWSLTMQLNAPTPVGTVILVPFQATGFEFNFAEPPIGPASYIATTPYYADGGQLLVISALPGLSLATLGPPVLLGTFLTPFGTSPPFDVKLSTNYFGTTTYDPAGNPLPEENVSLTIIGTVPEPGALLLVGVLALGALRARRLVKIG